MPFQFYCPQGHLLEAHESQMGQQSQCPYCASMLVIPVVQAAPAAPANWAPGYTQTPMQQPYQQVPMQPGYGQQPYPQMPMQQAYPQMPEMGSQAADPFPAVNTGAVGFAAVAASLDGSGGAAAPTDQAAPSFTGVGDAPATPAVEAPPEKKEPRVYRIPCPKGHELQTPEDMLGQDALCPICQEQFTLRYEGSIEFHEERAAAEARRQERINKAALRWSIGAAVFVICGLIGMAVYSALNKP